MAERQQMVVKRITFTESERSQMVLSDPTKIRLSSGENLVKLKEQEDGTFPLDTTLNVVAPPASAGAFRSFTGFQAIIRHKKVNGTLVTSARFRLHDGTDPYWWNGSAWAVATDINAHWNTEAEVATNIPAFTVPRTNGGVWGCVVNLATTSVIATPDLYELKFGVNLRVHSFLEDIVFRSIAQDLKAKLRPVTDLIWKMPATGSTIDIAAAVAATGIPFNIKGIDAAYVRTDDPGLLSDVAQSFNSGTNVLTLSAPVTSGKVVQICLIYEPEVVVQLTHQDFTEVEKIPSVIMHTIELVNSSQMQQADYILDKTTMAAKVVPPPYRATLSFRIDSLAPGGIDLARLSESIMEWADNNPTVKSKALGELYALKLREEFSNESRPGMSDVHTARMRAEVHDVLFFKRAAQDGFGVGTVKVIGTSIVSDQDDQAAAPLGEPPR